MTDTPEPQETRQEWRDISTAPKDGTELLVVDVRDIRNGQPYRSIARMGSRGNWLTTPGGWGIYPTHWTPLPSAPSASALDQEPTTEGTT